MNGFLAGANGSCDGGRESRRAVQWLAAFSLAFLCSCSFLQVHSYYTPSAPGGELRKEAKSRCAGNQGYVVSGPPQRIVVRSDGVALGIQAGAYRVTTITAGPLTLPVLPAFPPPFFPNRAIEAGDPLPIIFRILEPRDETVDFSGAVVEVAFSAESGLVDSSADDSNAVDSNAAAVDVDAGAHVSSTFEVGKIDDERTPFEGWTPLWDLSDGWTLPLRVGSGDPVPFRVSVRGLLLSGRAVDFPDVVFTPARGWLVCEERW